MPAIQLFGRRTFLGGDDLQLPCIFAIFWHLVQIFGFLIPIGLHIVEEAKLHGGLWNYIWYDADNFQCHNSHIMPLLLVLYSILSTLSALLNIIWEVRLFRASNLGCPIAVQPRSKIVEGLLEFKLVPLGIVQCMTLSLGIATVCFAKHYYDCSYDAMLSSNALYVENYFQDDNMWKSVTAIRLEQEETDNKPLLWWISYAFLWISQFLEAIFIVFTWLELLRRSPTSPAIILQHDRIEELWNDRCARLCECLGRSTCFMFGGRNISLGNYGDVARALADYLETGGTLDLVPSDVVMGLMVLRKIQRQRILQARSEVNRQASFIRESSSMDMDLPPSEVPYERQSFYVMHHEGLDTFYESTSRKVLDINKSLDRFALLEGARFSQYQLAVYTWVLYLYRHPIKGLPKLLTKINFCSCCSRDKCQDDEEQLIGGGIPANLVIGDNCCKTNKAALLLAAGIDDTTSELIYAQLHSSFSEVPYCIIVDHSWKCVVLAIRGTFSLEDCVTDVSLEPAPLEELGEEFGFDGNDQYCHGGVIKCARIIHKDLERHGILDKLLFGENAKYASYTLRIVGHSLGAGTAVLLSYMIRRKFTTLRCICYSPPGCSLSWRLATECAEWCSTFVLNSDLVPRLSVQSLEHLRDEVLDLVGRVKVSKAEVAQRTLPSGVVFRSSHQSLEVNKLDVILKDLLMDPSEIPLDSQYQLQLGSFKAVQAERRSLRGHLRSVMMYPPGRCVHFLKTNEKPSFRGGITKIITCCTTNFGSEYTPIWVQNNDFNEIVVSPTMGTDHFPNRMTDVLQETVSTYGLDSNQICLPDES
jgi:sn1-specific diacylglycerol lipase